MSDEEWARQMLNAYSGAEVPKSKDAIACVVFLMAAVRAEAYEDCADLAEHLGDNEIAAAIRARGNGE